MAQFVYDTQALRQFVDDNDLYGLRRTPIPPATLEKADQIRREPNAAAQWISAVFVFFLSALLSGVVVVVSLMVTTGMTDPAEIQKYFSELQQGGIAAHPYITANVLGLQALFATLLYWVGVRIFARRPVYELTGEGWFKEFCLGLLLGTVLIAIIIGVLFGMGHYKVDGVQFTPAFITAIFIGIGPAFAEEVVMRGFALRLLDKAIGSIPALIIVSVAFGLMHAGNKHVTLLQSLLLGISAGLLLGACYYLTRRLWLAIGLHLSWNFVQGGIFNSDVSGNGFSGGLLKASFNGPEWLTGGKMGIEGSALSIGLTIVVGLIILFMAHRRGNLNGRIGWNAPRINLLGSRPRVEIWAADGGWVVLPTPEELDAMLAPIDDEGEGVDGSPGHQNEPTLVDGAAATPVVPGTPEEPANPTVSTDEVDALLPPEDDLLTGELPATSQPSSDTVISPEDKTEQFEPISPAPVGEPEVTQDHPDWPSDAEMEAVQTKPHDGPPEITKVSSSVTTVKGTGTGQVTDADLDSTQQMDAVSEMALTDQIKPIDQPTNDETNDE